MLIVGRISDDGEHRIIIRPSDGNTAEFPLPMTTLAHKKSPTGVGWGYFGSGAAAAAHAILAYVCGELAANRWYQDYEIAVIARFPDNQGWIMNEDQVRQWLDEHAR